MSSKQEIVKALNDLTKVAKQLAASIATFGKQLAIAGRHIVRAFWQLTKEIIAPFVLLVLGSIHFAGCVLFTVFFSAIGINPVTQYWEMFNSPPAYSIAIMIMTMLAWFITLATEDMRPLG